MKLILNAITETGEVMIQKLLDAVSSAIVTENPVMDVGGS